MFRQWEPWVPTHQHLKSQGVYRVIAYGYVEASLEPCVIYDDQNGLTWVRPQAEFQDGRFRKLTRGEAGKRITLQPVTAIEEPAPMPPRATPHQQPNSHLKRHYECPVCGTGDSKQYVRCNRPSCPDGRDQ